MDAVFRCLWKFDLKCNLWVEGDSGFLYFEGTEHCHTIPGLDLNVLMSGRGGEEWAIRC